MYRTLLATLMLLIALPAQAGDGRLMQAAKDRLRADVRYDPAYVRLEYPNGDVPADTGVCTDVIIRSYRAAYDFDFQKAVHEDMRAEFSAYPKIWGLTRADKNIDHRRVPNLEAYLKRQGADLPISKKASDYAAGDLVTWRLPGNLPHIGIVSENKSRAGTPLIIHNIGAGPSEDDILFEYKINGHFRYAPTG